MQLLKSETGRVLIESHRGVQDGLPENSWPAIKAAKEQGADLIEVDVQLSKDGVPFVRHNYTLPDGRRCSLENWVELGRMTVDGEAFPLFEDVLAWAKDSRASLSLDLKTGFLPEGLLIRQVASQIQEMDCWGQVMLIAWDHKELLELKRSFPEAVTRILIHGRPIDIIGLVKAAEANAVSLAYGVARRDDVSSLHSKGIAVSLAEMWTFDTTEISNLDIDIICWGKPAEARKALFQ